ncbi:hypothetical protein V4S32_07995 [Enterococcus cecorum]
MIYLNNSEKILSKFILPFAKQELAVTNFLIFAILWLRLFPNSNYFLQSIENKYKLFHQLDSRLHIQFIYDNGIFILFSLIGFYILHVLIKSLVLFSINPIYASQGTITHISPYIKYFSLLLVLISNYKQTSFLKYFLSHLAITERFYPGYLLSFILIYFYYPEFLNLKSAIQGIENLKHKTGVIFFSYLVLCLLSFIIFALK